jgi:hypothetical protein
MEPKAKWNAILCVLQRTYLGNDQDANETQRLNALASRFISGYLHSAVVLVYFVTMYLTSIERYTVVSFLSPISVKR